VPRKPLLVESPDPHSPTTQVAVKVMPKKPLLVAGGDRSPLSLRTQVAVEIVPNKPLLVGGGPLHHSGLRWLLR